MNPGLSIVADVDESEPGVGIVFGADVEDGDGWPADVDIGSSVAVLGVGVTCVRPRHLERRTGARLDLHLGQRDVAIRTRAGNDTVAFRPSISVGGSLAPAPRIRCAGQAGRGLLFGYPSETVATGAFVSVGRGGLRD